MAENTCVSFRKNCSREKEPPGKAGLVSFHISRAQLLFYTLVYRSSLTYDGDCVQPLGRVRLSVIPWTVACQALLSMGFPRQNTGVGCHFLLQGIFPIQGSNPGLFSFLHWQVDSLPVVLVAESCLTLYNLMDCSPPGSSAHGTSPGKNTGVGSHSLLQGIFPTQGSNQELLQCK